MHIKSKNVHINFLYLLCGFQYAGWDFDGLNLKWCKRFFLLVAKSFWCEYRTIEIVCAKMLCFVPMPAKHTHIYMPNVKSSKCTMKKQATTTTNAYKNFCAPSSSANCKVYRNKSRAYSSFTQTRKSRARTQSNEANEKCVYIITIVYNSAVCQCTVQFMCEIQAKNSVYGERKIGKNTQTENNESECTRHFLFTLLICFCYMWIEFGVLVRAHTTHTNRKHINKHTLSFSVPSNATKNDNNSTGSTFSIAKAHRKLKFKIESCASYTRHIIAANVLGFGMAMHIYVCYVYTLICHIHASQLGSIQILIYRHFYMHAYIHTRKHVSEQWARDDDDFVEKKNKWKKNWVITNTHAACVRRAKES